MRKQLHIIFRLVMFSCILLFVSQEASAQITFSVKNQTIRQTIRVIEKKADYSFFYTDKLPGLDQKISLTVSNESIDAVLEKVFKGSSISYKIESGKQVVLTLKSEQNAPQKGDKKTITGVVADGLPGASLQMEWVLSERAAPADQADNLPQPGTMQSHIQFPRLAHPLHSICLR
jgi:hypothetical protein